MASLRQQLAELGAGAGPGRGTGHCGAVAAADGVHTQGGAGGAGEAAFTADQCTGAGTRRPAKGGERRHCTRVLTNHCRARSIVGGASLSAHFHFLDCFFFHLNFSRLCFYA